MNSQDIRDIRDAVRDLLVIVADLNKRLTDLEASFQHYITTQGYKNQ